ncbi:hypothetical protein V2J09_006477 [Rumex salicifolius]
MVLDRGRAYLYSRTSTLCPILRETKKRDHSGYASYSFSLRGTLLLASNEGLCRDLHVAEFSFNLQKKESTGKSPFKIAMVFQPSTPNTIISGYKGSTPTSYKFVKGWQEEMDLTHACLLKANKRIKKWVDQHRRDFEYQIGDLVMVKLHFIMRHKGLHKALIRWYDGPFRILKQIGKTAYKLELPSNSRDPCRLGGATEVSKTKARVHSPIERSIRYRDDVGTSKSTVAVWDKIKIFEANVTRALRESVGEDDT